MINKVTKVLIGGRYQYSPSETLKQSDLYSEYGAYDKSTKRDLIMHKMEQHDQYIEQIREVKHPFIHSVFDVVSVEDQNKVFVFFESGPQVSLDEALNKTHYLTQNDALVVFKFILLGLKQLHEKMIVYNRMSPQNILFCTYSLVKLGTFAYPQQVPMQYKSPEVLRNEKPSYASDIYSLGVVMYQMLYGCSPFDSLSEDNLLNSIRNKKFRELPTSSPFKILVSKELKVLLQSMLDYFPEKRPSLEDILKVSFLAFPVDIQLQSYTKPKSTILPESFMRRYLVLRASRLLYRIDDYYEESCYLAISIKDKEFVTFVTPDVKMFEADPRKIQSYFEKLRAIKESYMPETCGYLCRIDDHERFRREPVLMLQYCNHGDLYHYLEKYKKYEGKSFAEQDVNLLMYLVAISYKQMNDIGITSIQTVHSQRILIKNSNIKIREPGLITPFIENKLRFSSKVDYFAPELKEKSDFVEFDKSDMWSFGVLYYFLLHGSMPQVSSETKTINIDILNGNRKNKNLIGKCLDQNMSRRVSLNQIKIQNLNESLLEKMLEEKKREQEEVGDVENLSDSEDPERMKKDNRVIFKSRKKNWFKNYNKIIANSSTSSCRIVTKIIMGLVVLWVLFFGEFFVNGGIGMLRTNYYRTIALEVPNNYATSRYTIMILSTNGTKFENEYKDYSYQQYKIDLRCTENNHTQTIASLGVVDNYINYTHSVQCVFGFIFAILISACYAIIQVKLDLPKVLVDRKEKQNNTGLLLFLVTGCMLCGLLFSFFTLFVFEYVIQMYPCLGIISQALPKFTAIESLLNGDVGLFFRNLFPTVILWSILMILYIFLTLLNRKVNSKVLLLKFIIPVVVFMVLETVICRIGFGLYSPIEPSWSYRMSLDLVSHHWGLIGQFPEVMLIPLILLDRFVDFIFWFFLRLGMEPADEGNIMEVEFNAKLEPLEAKQLQVSKSNIIQNDFELFD